LSPADVPDYSNCVFYDNSGVPDGNPNRYDEPDSYGYYPLTPKTLTTVGFGIPSPDARWEATGLWWNPGPLISLKAAFLDSIPADTYLFRAATTTRNESGQTTGLTFVYVAVKVEGSGDAVTPNKAYVLTSALGNNLVIDIEAASTSPGAQAILWTSHGLANQRLVFVDAGEGYFYIQSVSSGLVLDIEGGVLGNGTKIIQWPKHEGDNQKWKFSNFGAGRG
jgi:hypothetical protein